MTAQTMQMAKFLAGNCKGEKGKRAGGSRGKQVSRPAKNRNCVQIFSMQSQIFLFWRTGKRGNDFHNFNVIIKTCTTAPVGHARLAHTQQDTAALYYTALMHGIPPGWRVPGLAFSLSIDRARSEWMAPGGVASFDCTVASVLFPSLRTSGSRDLRISGSQDLGISLDELRLGSASWSSHMLLK